MDIIPAEIIGTMLLILLGDGVVAAVLLAKSKAENSGWIVITFGWGFAVMVGAYSVGQFTGAHLNPAVTLGIWINGGIDFGEAIQYWIGEFIGAAIGAVLVLGSYWQHFQQTEDPGLKLAVLLDGPRDPEHVLEPVHGGRRHLRPRARDPRDDRRRQQGGRPQWAGHIACRLPRRRHRLVARWPDGVRDQPGA